MNILLNNQRVATSFKSLKTKIKQSNSPVTNGSIITIKFRKSELQYKVTTSLFKGKKESFTNVRFNLI